MSTAVYIHIPYCQSKCNYCDFLSFAVSSCEIAPHIYLQALEKELALRGEELKKAGIKVATLYIGGGTPTILPHELVSQILASCHRHLPLDKEVEWTVEANPSTISLELVKLLVQAGVNRISLGVQDLCDERLALLGRTHTAAQAKEAILMCRNYFPVLSLDLMTGLPKQTTAQLLETLAVVCSWEPQHLSLYGLQVEDGTKLAAQLAAGLIQLPDEDEVGEMFMRSRKYLQSRGYEHYEIANFALKGFQCRHNLTYWQNRPYLGLGLGAHSYWQNERLANTSCLYSYVQCLAAGQLPVTERLVLSRQREIEDTIMLGLRLRAGIKFADFQKRFGLDLRRLYAQQLQCLSALGVIQCDEESISLTESGLPVANLVFAEFIA